jgi:hypothetical protein
MYDRNVVVDLDIRLVELKRLPIHTKRIVQFVKLVVALPSMSVNPSKFFLIPTRFMYAVKERTQGASEKANSTLTEPELVVCKFPTCVGLVYQEDGLERIFCQIVLPASVIQ